MKRTKMKVAGIMGIVLSSIILLFALLNILDLVFALTSLPTPTALSRIFAFVSVLFYSVPGLLLASIIDIGPAAIIVYVLNIVLLIYSIIWLVVSVKALGMLKASSDDLYAKKSMFKRTSVFAFVFAGFLLVGFIASMILTGRIVPQLLLLLVFAGVAIAYGVLLLKQMKNIPIDEEKPKV